MIKFSIIIPVRTINEFLRENISYLMKLDYDAFEVIIIPDNEETYDFKGDARFRILVSGMMGPGEKRNLGAHAATGEILAFLDDDAYPSKNWLVEAAKVFSERQIYALGCPAVTPTNAKFLEECSGLVLESHLASAGTLYRHKPKKAQFVDDYPSVNLFVKKDAFLAVGGFIKEFWPGEDTKLCLDLIEKFNMEIYYDPRPIVYHHRRDLFRPHLKQVSRYGRHRGQFARIFPKNSRRLSYFIPSFFVLGIIVGAFASLISQLLAILYFATLFFYGMLLLVTFFQLVFLGKGVKKALYVCAGIFLTHIVYGLNFLRGFIFKPKLELRAVDPKTGNYTGG